MVKEMEGSAAVLPGGDGEVDCPAAVSCNSVGGAASSGISREGDAADMVAVALLAMVALLAIASPKPATIDRGSENSSSQCNPVTQLNTPRDIYIHTKHNAQMCIPVHH